MDTVLVCTGARENPGLEASTAFCRFLPILSLDMLRSSSPGSVKNVQVTHYKTVKDEPQKKTQLLRSELTWSHQFWSPLKEQAKIHLTIIGPV
ncbi:hypothetical protein STEG23_004137, partial [Scotinomys teguina]